MASVNDNHDDTRSSDDFDIDIDAADELHPIEDDAPEGFESGTILPRVQQLLTRITSDEEAKRYERFFRAASLAIERLGELDVSGTDVEDPDTKDVSFWEQLAPAVTHTLNRVESFLEVVRSEFPITEVEQNTALDAAFDDAFSENSDGGAPPVDSEPLDSIQGAANTLQSFCSNLTHELRLLQEGLKSPSLMSDRWNLLERLGEFRGRARSAIGEMVFVGARLFAVVRKEDVVPFYKEDVDSSLELRRSVSALRAHIDVHRARLARLNLGTEREAARACIGKILEEFDGFTHTAVYRSMRAVDKRTFLEVRRGLVQLSQRGELRAKRVETSVEGLARFLDSLGMMNQRELLLAHDRESTDTIIRELDATIDAVVDDRAALAQKALQRALEASERLLGREPTFDVLLKLFGHTDLREVDLPDMLAMAQLMKRQL